MERVQQRATANDLTHNKTQMRLTVELDPGQLPTLVSFVKYCEQYENKQFAKLYGVSCLVDTRTTPAKEIKRLMKVATTKERTWWLSFAPIPVSAIVKVEFNVKGKFEPYEFELHGREAMRKLGLTFPSPQALADLREIITPANAHEMPKAWVFCEDPAKPAKVAIRGGGGAWWMEIGTGALVAGIGGEPPPALGDWLGRHRAELEACSSEAVEIYYAYYPERRPAAVTSDAAGAGVPA